MRSPKFETPVLPLLTTVFTVCPLFSVGLVLKTDIIVSSLFLKSFCYVWLDTYWLARGY